MAEMKPNALIPVLRHWRMLKATNGGKMKARKRIATIFICAISALAIFCAAVYSFIAHLAGPGNLWNPQGIWNYIEHKGEIAIEFPQGVEIAAASAKGSIGYEMHGFSKGHAVVFENVEYDSYRISVDYFINQRACKMEAQLQHFCNWDHERFAIRDASPDRQGAKIFSEQYRNGRRCKEDYAFYEVLPAERPFGSR